MVMKSIANKLLVLVMAAAIALPAMAQTIDAQKPNTEFRSTSTMPASGSAYSSTPMFNANGTAEMGDDAGDGSAHPGNPRRVGPPTPEGPPTPVGDAAVPLMLFALAYAACVNVRRRVCTRSYAR